MWWLPPRLQKQHIGILSNLALRKQQHIPLWRTQCFVDQSNSDWIQIPGILLKACLRCSVSTLAIRLPVLCPLLTHIFIYSLIVQHLRCYSALMMKLQMSGLKMLLAICDWGECEWTRFFFKCLDCYTPFGVTGRELELSPWMNRQRIAGRDWGLSSMHMGTPAVFWHLPWLSAHLPSYCL